MSERDLTPGERWMRDLALQTAWPAPKVGPCPDDETLAARVEGGRLQGLQRQALDAHLAGCDPCRQLVQDLILDGAGEHLPSPQPEIARATPWWSGALAALFPRRLISGFAPVALTLVAFTALAAYAVPQAMQMYQEATAPPAPIKTVWTVTSKDDAPKPEVAVAAEPTLPSLPDLTPEPPTPVTSPAPVAKAPAPAGRPLRTLRTLTPAAPTAAPAPVPPAAPGEAAAVILPKLEPAPVVKPEPVVEAPAPTPIPEREAFTEMDRVFIEEYGKALVLVHERQYGLALRHLDQMRPAASHSVKYTGILNTLRNKAQRGLDNLRGPCKDGYIWGMVRQSGNTLVERCILPEQAEKLLDF